MSRLRAMAVGVLTLAVIGGAAGCAADRFQQAVDNATASVRRQAGLARDEMAAILREPGDPPGLVDRLSNALSRAPIDGTVFHTDQAADAVTIDAAFTERSQAGGGLSYENATVRLCVRLQGAVGPHAHVDVADTACGPSLPTEDPDAGRVDRVVTWMP